MSLYLKWTSGDRVPSHQGGASIPYRKWTERVEHPELCVRGWHACRWDDAVHHIADELWICELDGDVIAGNNKVVGERLRIVRKVVGVNERSLRLFAADCAEDVLPLFERERPDDDRPRRAISAARAFAEGRITRTELTAAKDAAKAAARDAVRDAARAAAWAAAGDATGAATLAAAWDATLAAAWAAAWDAARDATLDATWDAAWDAARAAQTERLLVTYGGLDPTDFAQKVSS